MEQCFSLKDAFNKEVKESFLSCSSIKIKNLIAGSICKEACKFVYENEDRLIDKYSYDPKGLTIDIVDNKKFIKYFEYPFRENSKVFGKFVNSNIFKISEFLLESPVFLKSLEIHSRCAKGTIIPPHQDNAYYGLKGGKALTFYIPINKELASMGGLKYFKNSNEIKMNHKPSDSSGFSLTVDNIKKINFDIFAPDFLPGDCTIHHSRSIHFADAVPSNAERSLVVRLSIYSINDEVRDGHAQWYENMIKRNRKMVSNLFIN